MKTGVLIFAFNSEQIDYLAMAAWSADNIHRHLGLPVCVVTDIVNVPNQYNFDQIVYAQPLEPSYRHFGDIEQVVPWYNGNRVDAYALSPWDQTLVLDADYIVASNQLQTLLSADQDFLAHRLAYDITGLQPFTDLNCFGRHEMPMWWATVMLFRRGQTAELIFNSMQMVRKNWSHYRNLYKNPRATYRNDHALSIALCLVNGHTLNHGAIPWDLATLTSGQTLEYINQDHYKINFFNAQKQLRWISLKNQDFHAMGKGHLGAMIANIK